VGFWVLGVFEGWFLCCGFHFKIGGCVWWITVVVWWLCFWFAGGCVWVVLLDMVVGWWLCGVVGYFGCVTCCLSICFLF